MLNCKVILNFEFTLNCRSHLTLKQYLPVTLKPISTLMSASNWTLHSAMKLHSTWKSYSTLKLYTTLSHAQLENQAQLWHRLPTQFSLSKIQATSDPCYMGPYGIHLGSIWAPLNIYGHAGREDFNHQTPATHIENSANYTGRPEGHDPNLTLA